MYQLLIMVLIVEGIMAFLLVVKIGPFRDLVMKVIDQLKTGKGPEITVKTIVGVMSLILASSVYNFLWIQNKNVKHGTLTPMDQVLVRTHLLDSSLIGTVPSISISLFEISVFDVCLYVNTSVDSTIKV